MGQADPATISKQLVQFAGTIAAAVQTPLAIVDGGLRIVVANQAFIDLLEDSANLDRRELFCLDAGRWDRPAFREALSLLVSDDCAFERCELPGRGGRRLLASGRPLAQDDRAAPLILLTFGYAASSGAPALRVAAGSNGQQDALVAELAHRVKNLLAMVQALALQTDGPDVETYRKALLSRLKTLALAHGALLESALERAPLQGLLHELLAPFREGDPERVAIDGPPVALSQSQVTIFALIIHELASNAARNGALSAPEGRVLVSWTKEDGLLRLDWREQGVPGSAGRPAGAVAEDDGFGTLLIRRAVSYQLRGTAELYEDLDGFRCSLAFPLKGAA